MDDPNDVRTHKIEPQTLSIDVDLEVLCEPGDHSAFVRNLADELASMLTTRIAETQGVTHMNTPTYTVNLE